MKNTWPAETGRHRLGFHDQKSEALGKSLTLGEEANREQAYDRAAVLDGRRSGNGERLVEWRAAGSDKGMGLYHEVAVAQ